MALFHEAERQQPSMIFFDDIDGTIASAQKPEQSYARKLLSCFKEELTRVQMKICMIMGGRDNQQPLAARQHLRPSP
jgi:SpoVK/Ycf46/Vps4 family AAA+-type ATPase